jgi:diguanylate cyclase (GGDEF)-like protein
MHGILRNIDEWIQLQKDLEYRISHDALTGAFSRNFFERMMKRYDDEVDVPMAIIQCDLDELKTVNDHFGHREGDRLIKEAAKILMNFQSEKVLVSRIGGDEFAILVIEMELSEVEKLVEKMDEAINGYNNRDWPMKMSYGYAFSRSSKGNMERLFEEADRNMYDNKFGKKP